ncbi:hypothetical protein SAMN05428982_3057 [Pseudoxanthomonas sp. CF385]|uniref:hypothetical protein n=1 Tax=Pseudoxanthomonas sp. CF385 TaxID=1881042 RepID=UPI000880D3F2|nr:hypothetical protein [Pseudoxanthomonas sp. CF385]SDR04881.1 hypothetical protein SAMN05428982_3057 [Pseudoxanthomonas sp. CF385]
MRPLPRPLFLALATAIAAAPAASAPTSGPPTQVWIDVATHSMAGMPDLGPLGGMASRMMGGGGQQAHYGQTRMPRMTGQYLDIALYNRPNPGKDAEQRIPAGLRLGKSLPLVPPVRTGASPERTGEYTPPEGQARVLVYWGCGTTVRKGQPKIISISASGGKVEVSGSMKGRYAPDRDIDADPAYALWPNPKSGKRVPDGASLQGAHQITGPGVPESLKFELKQVADFMPKIDLQSTGSLAEGQTWRWAPVDRAQAYFLHAIGTHGKDVVLWSSAEVPDAGQGIFDYLTGSLVDRWTKEKVLLPSSTTQCAVPKGIFAAPGEQGNDRGGGLLSIIAYGPESHIAWPPKPSDPKQAWHPEWNVRVRAKSTSSAMLGMDLAQMQDMDQDEEEKPQEQKKPLRGLLKGLIGG